MKTGSLCFLLFACSTVRVTVPVTKPAEINMVKYRQVAVDKLSGRDGPQISELLEAALLDSGRFTVVDRQHLGQIMGELRLSASELSDPSKAAQLGRQLPASALIFGNVERSDYREEVLRGEPYTVPDLQGNPHTHVNITRRGTADVRVSFQITDVETGSLLKVKMIEKQNGAERSAIDKQPEPLDREALLAQARDAVVRDFMKSIAPYKVSREVAFRKDGDLPQLEGAIHASERGNWEHALELCNAAIDQGEKGGLKSKVLAKAYFDRGLVEEFMGQFDKAKADVSKADEYDTDADFEAELDNIAQAQKDAAKLAQENAGM